MNKAEIREAAIDLVVSCARSVLEDWIDEEGRFGEQEGEEVWRAASGILDEILEKL